MKNIELNNYSFGLFIGFALNFFLFSIYIPNAICAFFTFALFILCGNSFYEQWRKSREIIFDLKSFISGLYITIFCTTVGLSIANWGIRDSSPMKIWLVGFSIMCMSFMLRGAFLKGFLR